MPSAKALSGHSPCSLYLFSYLEVGDDGARALAHDFFNIEGEDRQERWAEVMDATRAAYGHDAPVRGKPGRTYLHYIISPDPRDGVSLDDLRSLVCEWVGETFEGVPEGVGEERNCAVKGRYQIAVVYHDDNYNRIPHAHLVINCSDLSTGRKMHLDKVESRRLFQALQRIAVERGLHYFDTQGFDREPEEFTEAALFQRLDQKAVDLVSKAGEAGVTPQRFDKTERDALSDGRVSWKTHLRDLVNVAIAESVDMEGFWKKLEAEKIAYEDRPAQRDVLFYYSEHPERRVKGSTLGSSYVPDAIAQRVAANAREWGRGREDARRRYVDTFDAHCSRLLEAIAEPVSVIAYNSSCVEFHELAEALRVNAEQGITSMADYDVVVKKWAVARVRARKAGDVAQERELTNRIREVEASRRVARHADLFAGVEPDWASPKWREAVVDRAAVHRLIDRAATPQERAHYEDLLEQYDEIADRLRHLEDRQKIAVAELDEAAARIAEGLAGFSSRGGDEADAEGLSHDDAPVVSR